MNYIRFDRSVDLPRLGMGAMRLPAIDDSPETIDYAKASEIIDYCIDHGVNYFDTSYIYHGGKSETFLGEALAQYPRDSYFLADKFNLQANPDYRAQFADQLSRLNTDRIDFYLLHGVQDQTVAPMLSCGCVEYFDGLKAVGKIRYLGFSFHGSPDGLLRMLGAYAWDFVQIQLNYFDWMYGDAKALYEILDQANMPVMVMEPLRGGRLASLTIEASAMLNDAMPGRSIASWGMRWLMDLPRVAVVLSGMSDIAQVEENIVTFSEYSPLDEAQKEILQKACALFRPSVSVACTNCRYCCNDCPKGLDIPRMLSVFNEIKLGGDWRISFLDSLPEGRHPGDCIGCGSCAGHCPQGFDIPAYIGELAKISERMKRS